MARKTEIAPINTRIPQPLLKRLQAASEASRIPQSRLVEEALEALLPVYEKKSKRAS